MTKRYTEKEIQKFVRLFKSAWSANEICEMYGMARSSLLLWAKQYSEASSNIKTAREIYLLEKEVARLRTENQIYKLSGCTTTSNVKRFARQGVCIFHGCAKWYYMYLNFTLK